MARVFSPNGVKKYHLTLYQKLGGNMVEPRGVEPLSEDQLNKVSPSAVCVLTFPLPDSHKQDSGFSSFIKSHRPQSLRRLVPCFYDAADLRRRRLRGDDRGLSRESYVVVVVSSFLVPVVEAVQGCRSLLCPSASPSKPFTAPRWMAERSALVAQ